MNLLAKHLTTQLGHDSFTWQFIMATLEQTETENSIDFKIIGHDQTVRFEKNDQYFAALASGIVDVRSHCIYGAVNELIHALIPVKLLVGQIEITCFNDLLQFNNSIDNINIVNMNDEILLSSHMEFTDAIADVIEWLRGFDLIDRQIVRELVKSTSNNK